MCIPWKKQIAEALLLLCLPLVAAGCGGGGGGGASAAITGVATKGPIAGGAVAVYRLLQTGARGALLGSGSTGADGSYAVAIPAAEAAGPLLITVTGKPGATYTSESTGLPVPFSAAESFSAAVDSVAVGQSVTVSPLTEAAFQKLPLILAQKPGPLSAEKIVSSIVAANAQVGDLLNVGSILAPPAADPSYLAALLIIDRMVQDSKASGVITDTSAAMTVLNQAVADIDPAAPAYQTFLGVFTAAAQQVQLDNPGAVANTVAAITAQVASPPAEPDFTDVTAPATVTGLSAATVALTASTSSVVLSWSPSTDNSAVAGYDVFRDGVRIATVTTPGYTDPSVTSNIAYAYTVVAFDAAGNRATASAALSVTPNPAPLTVTVSGQLSSDILGLPQSDILAPTAPTNLSAVTAAVSGTNSSVTLSWSAASDAVAVTGYEVFRDGVMIATVTTTGYTDPSVQSGLGHSYTVKAFDAAGNRSAASTALSVTPNQASLGVTVSGQVNPGLS